ncbi:MAG: rhomboid family intramembrane serine protease [Planctomycetota bacterium]
MFIPLGDHPNPPKPQWVTRILLATNLAIYLFVSLPLSGEAVTEEDWADPANRQAFQDLLQRTGVSYEDLDANPAQRAVWLRKINRYALFTQSYGYKPGRPGLLTLLFCMFLHADFWHIAGNMLFLWIFGDNVEWRLGRPGYLAAYLVTGIVATLSFSAFAGDSVVPLIGASGAISGVLGLYLVWFPHNQIRVLVFLFFIFFVHVRAIWVLLMYLVIDNLLPFLAQQQVGGGGVAYGAHLGGFVAGMGGALLLNRLRGVVPPPRPGPRLERRRVRWGAAPARETLPAAADAGAEFGKAIQQGRMEDAAHAFSRVVREGGAMPAPSDVFRLGNWLYENDFIPDTAAVFRYYVRNFPRGDDLDRVHLGLGILLARRLGQPAAAREHLLQAIDLTETDSSIATTAREELARLEGT